MSTTTGVLPAWASTLVWFKILSFLTATSRTSICASMVAPSTTVSGAKFSVPKLTSSYPPLVDFSSTALMELDPISSPTSCLLFPPRNDITRPLSQTLARLPAPLHLAHLALHPAIQDGFP